MFAEVKQAVQDHHTFLLTSHLNPDADGVGSAVALAELLLLQGKRVRTVFDSDLPANLKFLDFHHLFERYSPEGEYGEVEVVIVLDTNRRSRIGQVATLLDQVAVSICIDHHLMAAPFTTLSAIDPDACSVGAQVYTLFKESGFPLNQRAAMGIYASIVSDTSRFSNGATSRKAHKLADECLKYGVNPEEMHTHLYRQVSAEQLELFGRILQRKEFYFEGRLLLETVTLKDCEETGASGDDLEYLHEFHKSLRDIDCALILRELEGRVRLSARSMGECRVDSAMVALGGGGHSKAAGATVEGSLDEVKQLALSHLACCFSGQVHNTTFPRKGR